MSPARFHRLTPHVLRLTAALGLAVAAVRAQQPNPMMQLMQSQPPMDFDSPVVATAVVDPPIAVAGELVVYRISLNALEASVRWPAEMFPPPGVDLKPAGSGQLVTMVGGIQKPITGRNFHLRAARPGFYTLPAFEIQAYGKRVIVPEARFEAVSVARPGLESARRLYVQPAKTNVYVGEPLSVRVLAPGSASNVVSGLSQLQFNGDGVLGGKTPVRQLVEPREIAGRKVSTFIYETVITPITAGDLELSVQGFTAGMFFSGPVVLQGQLTLQGLGTENVLLDSEPLQLKVQALPIIASDQGFTGYIGQLGGDPPWLSTNRARVGDALRLVVTFHWPVNATARLQPPPAPRVEGWQVYPPTPTEPPPRPPSTNAYAAFAYTLIPVSEEVKSTPVIPFHIFDPERGAYVNLSIPAQPVTVTTEGLATNWLSEVAALEMDSPRAHRPQLNEIRRQAGPRLAPLSPRHSQLDFWLLHFGPVAGLLAWWGQARRQRHLAAHPEIVRRRQARRELRRCRRQLRRHFRAGDAGAIRRDAVRALQIATAPHFPAEARALVGGDVLAHLPAADQTGRAGELVRQLFAQHDAASFAAAQPTLNDAARTWQPELERVLRQLEARL
jgi:hypothetical protein